MAGVACRLGGRIKAIGFFDFDLASSGRVGPQDELLSQRDSPMCYCRERSFENGLFLHFKRKWLWFMDGKLEFKDQEPGRSSKPGYKRP